MSRKRRIRPYRVPALIIGAVGAALIVASVVQGFFGVPMSEGIAPAGLSLGPILCAGAAVLYFSSRPRRGERRDDGLPVRQMEDVLHAIHRDN
ncbi:ubiquitin family protein [Rhizomonospora bruguierae]|uniref:hypothetical protein n=1 Tax=Rhizomonospora bruguierae TaxID=1581705 RepID=UPI001BD016EB|nr:hypothetical protein [Micromonospora sp. NBRC 107566]